MKEIEKKLNENKNIIILNAKIIINNLQEDYDPKRYVQHDCFDSFVRDISQTITTDVLVDIEKEDDGLISLINLSSTCFNFIDEDGNLESLSGYAIVDLSKAEELDDDELPLNAIIERVNKNEVQEIIAEILKKCDFMKNFYNEFLN